MDGMWAKDTIMGRATLVSCLAVVGGCAGPAIKLPEDPLRLTVVQRRAAVIPGSRDRVLLWVGDVTEGQVLVAVCDHRGKPYLRTRSVREGDTAVFRIDGNRYYLSVVELRNFVVGDDFGVFEISSEPPRRPRAKDESS